MAISTSCACIVLNRVMYSEVEINGFKKKKKCPRQIKCVPCQIKSGPLLEGGLAEPNALLATSLHFVGLLS